MCADPSAHQTSLSLLPKQLREGLQRVKGSRKERKKIRKQMSAAADAAAAAGADEPICLEENPTKKQSKQANTPSSCM
jgi:hypothetical protein